MPRPKIRFSIQNKPKSTFFKPQGIPLKNLEIVTLSHEEWEALRLKNYQKLNQTKAAKKKQTSQSTFQRILTNAQEKIAQALVESKAIEVKIGIE